jgi:hypothetical protein
VVAIPGGFLIVMKAEVRIYHVDNQTTRLVSQGTLHESPTCYVCVYQSFSTNSFKIRYAPLILIDGMCQSKYEEASGRGDLENFSPSNLQVIPDELYSTLLDADTYYNLF